MSKIHQALRNTQRQRRSFQKAAFNPLSGRQNRPNLLRRLSYIFSALLITSALAMTFFWPQLSEWFGHRLLGYPANQTAEERAALAKNEIQPVQAQAALETTASASETDQTVSIADAAIQAKTSEPAETVASDLSTETNEQSPGIQLAIAPPIQALAEPRQAPVQPTKPKETATTAQQPITAKPAVNTPPSLAANAPEPSTPSIRRSSLNWQEKVSQALQAQDLNEAEQQLKLWIGAQPDAAEPRLMLARIYISREHHLAAEPLLANLQGQIEADALLGLIYEKTQRHALAADTFKQLYRKQPSNHKWLLFWAINSENSNQLEIAKRLYQTYISQFSQVDSALTGFAQRRLSALGGVQ
ncbi:hypothetical protein [Reinekea thalattae]|uniref:Tetratricopeptide repeat protein n=1 Tax=Reinekea thalattae TaxID=2593301 RepID=A0A5C8Z873_9GAMM|nr:hypothetical protein [Reinekea thalattae]TXR54305.1 hypothetical protein FME95_07150 [Reinekea thalattae]